MPSTTMTIDQLALSPHNVRKNRQDQLETGAIERSLLASGQMFPLLVHPMKGRTDLFGVFAGGRRWRAFRTLIERGDLPPDHPIDVVVRDLKDAELTELSLAENLVRRDLRPYEEYAAVLTAQKRGASLPEIAEAIGQPLIWVNRALRMATLAPELLAALETGRVSVAQAQAFGATEDHAAQVAAWRALCGNGDAIAAATTPAQIRGQLKVGDQELLRLLRFVGDEAYRQAGGRFELDLFADQAEQRGRVTDEGLLRALAAARMDEVRAEQRALAGREVRFQAKPPQTSYQTTDYALQIEPERTADGAIALPQGDVVGTIDVGPKGEAEVRWWWASHAAKRGKKQASAKSDAPGRAQPSNVYSLRPPAEGEAIGTANYDNARQRADAAIKEQEGLTAEGVSIFRSLRRAILRAGLVQAGREQSTFPRDYLVWAQLRMHLQRAGQYGADSFRTTGVQRLNTPEGDPDAARAFVDASEAGRAWATAIAELKAQPFMAEAELSVSLTLYRRADRAVKLLAEAVVAGLGLERSLDAAGYACPVHDEVAGHVGVASERSIRHWWTPTAGFLELLPTAERRDIVKPFLEPAAFAAWTKLKSAELTPMVLRVVMGDAPNTRKVMQVAAAQWVHPLLTFARPNATRDFIADAEPEEEPDPGANDADTLELAEAAE